MLYWGWRVETRLGRLWSFRLGTPLTMKELGIDHERVNMNGGAIVLGHPLSGTNAIWLGTALDEFERADFSTALVTLCIGGGQGVVTIMERV